MNFENGELNVRRTIGTGDLWSGGTARRSGRTVASMRMVMHSHLLNAGLSVPGRIGVIAVDAAGAGSSTANSPAAVQHRFLFRVCPVLGTDFPHSRVGTLPRISGLWHPCPH